MKNRNYKTDKNTIKANNLGFSARSVFKLEEIDKKYRLLKPKLRVLDLGASPGSFMQLCRTIIKDGYIIGCDLKEIPDFRNSIDNPFTMSFVCDLLSPEDEFEEGLAKIFKERLSDIDQEFDLILSDAMGNTSGIGFLDHECSMDLAHRGLEICQKYLRPHGKFVCKFFSGHDQHNLVKSAKDIFETVKIEKPEVSKRSKKEFFLVCIDRKVQK